MAFETFGKIVGKSEMYKSEDGAKRGVKAVIESAKGEGKVCI